VLPCKGFEEIQERQQKQKEKAEYWLFVIRDAMTMIPGELATQYVREWRLRRHAIERLMLEASKRKIKAWGGKLSGKNIWIWGAPGLGKSRWPNELKVTAETFKKSTRRSGGAALNQVA
jgi:predicted ATP-dependent serine protease